MFSLLVLLLEEDAFDFDINDYFAIVNLKIVEALSLEMILQSLIHGSFYLEESQNDYLRNF